MKIRYEKELIEIYREMSALDRFVIDFVSVLDKLEIKYVIISGYVSILFGRSRISEDIDIIIEKIDEEGFRNLWNALRENFECIITKDVGEAYSRYLMANHAVRFSRKGNPIPNIEMTFPKTGIESWVVSNPKKIRLNGHGMLISPLELQIPFKLFLGSEKDIEDARHLYRLLADNMDSELLADFTGKLKVNDAFNKYLRDKNESA